MSSAPKKSPAAAKLRAGGETRSDANSVQGSAPLPLNRYAIFFALACLGCAADLFTKQATFDWLGVDAQFVDISRPENLARWRGDANLDHLWWLLPGRLGVQTSINRGALFGLGPGGWPVFSALALGAVVGILVWLFKFRAAHDRWLTVALALVTGGILGNLYDRLGLWNNAGLKPEFQHAVRDWILFVWPEVKLWFFNPWPNFNIADSLLVTGAIMLVIHALVWRDQPAESALAARAGTPAQ